MIRVSFEQMYEELMRVLLKTGFTEERAKLCAKLFTQTSCDGVYSHGLNRFPRFMEYIKKGLVNIDAVPEKIDGMGTFERWDGKLGPGNLNAYFSMNRAITIAKENGMGCVALRNTNHWMRGGSYGWQAAEAGCIGICWTNTIPNMPPWGARENKIGNNPLILAVPRNEGHVVLDMAMSQFSYGKIEVYRMREELLPVDGGFDTQGSLTRDPKAIEESGRPLSVGYWKGSGLSILLDLIAALLSGGDSTYRVGKHSDVEKPSHLRDEYGVSQVFIAFDPAKFSGRGMIEDTVNEVVRDIHGSLPASEGGRIYYPGERTIAVREENLRSGIPVEESIWEKVRNM